MPSITFHRFPSMEEEVDLSCLCARSAFSKYSAAHWCLFGWLSNCSIHQAYWAARHGGGGCQEEGHATHPTPTFYRRLHWKKCGDTQQWCLFIPNLQDPFSLLPCSLFTDLHPYSPCDLLWWQDSHIFNLHTISLCLILDKNTFTFTQPISIGIHLLFQFHFIMKAFFNLLKILHIFLWQILPSLACGSITCCAHLLSDSL